MSILYIKKLSFSLISAFDFAMAKGKNSVENFGTKLIDNIFCEIVSSSSVLLNEIDLYDKEHKSRLMKRIISSFIRLKVNTSLAPLIVRVVT